MAFGKFNPYNQRFSPFFESLEYTQKILEATHLNVDFSQAFDSKHREKTEKILLTYGLPKETIIAIMILYKNTKAMVHSLNSDRLLRRCQWSLAKRYISGVYIQNLSRLRARYVNRSDNCPVSWGCRIH